MSPRPWNARDHAHPRAQRKFGFLSLPAELRIQIYSEIYIHAESVFICQPQMHRSAFSCPLFPLALSRTCRQIYHEAMEIFYTKNSFVLDLNLSAAVDLLKALSNETTRRISCITLGRALMEGSLTSSPLKHDLVSTLGRWQNLSTVSVMVPDEMPAITGGLIKWIPVNDYSWTLLGKLVDDMQHLGVEQIRLVWNHTFPKFIWADPEKWWTLYAVRRVLRREAITTSDPVFRIERTRTCDGKLKCMEKAVDGKYTLAQRRNKLLYAALNNMNTTDTSSTLSILQVKKRTEGGWYID